jgi:dissimilatory sulfite reductase (desulfoviridin) alpha/beta subunit
MKAQLYFAKGAAGISVIVARSHRQHASRVVEEVWFCARGGDAPLGQKATIPSSFSPDEGLSAALDLAKQWMNDQAWSVAPQSSPLSQELQGPLEDREKVKAELFRIGLCCPALLDFMAATTKCEGLDACCSEAIELCRELKIEELKLP